MNSLALAIKEVRNQDKVLKRHRDDSDKLDMILNDGALVDKRGRRRPFVKKRFLLRVQRQMEQDRSFGFLPFTWDDIMKWVSENIDLIIQIAVRLLMMLVII